MNGEQVQQLREVFGDPLLLYVLSIDSIPTLDEGAFTSEQEMVLAALEQLRVANQTGTGTPEGFVWAARISIDRYVDEAGGSIANVLRAATGGGALAVQTSSDPVLAQLLRMLPDVYPGYLLPDDGKSFMPRTSAAPFQHPAKAELEAAILADPALSKLFTEEQGHSGWMGSNFRSTGQGGSSQLWSFAGNEFAIAHAWASLEDDAPTINDVAAKLELCLATIRRAVQNKRTTVPVRIGLTGVLLPDSVSEVDLGWAKLRRPSEADRRTAKRTGVEGTLRTTTPEGAVITIDYAGDVVLAIDAPYKAVFGKTFFDEVTQPWPVDLSATKQAVEIVETLRLALALALDDDQPALCTACRDNGARVMRRVLRSVATSPRTTRSG